MSRTASARAVSGSRPAAIFFSMRSSMYASSSSSRSPSTADWRNRVRRSAPMRGRTGTSSLAEHLRDGERDGRPLFLFHGEPPAAGRGQLVTLDAAAQIVGRPLAGDQPFALEAMERREERSRFDAEGAAGDLLEAVGDAESVARLEFERAEDQE